MLYVEELIAPPTINTIPPATMDAFRDHGKVRLSLEEDIDQAKQMMATLDQSGISIDTVTGKLIEDGVQLFADAFDKLLGAVARKRAVILDEKLDSQTYKLSSGLEREVIASLESWRHDGNVRRLYAGDAHLWTGSDEATWLAVPSSKGFPRKLSQFSGISRRASPTFSRHGRSSLGAEYRYVRRQTVSELWCRLDRPAQIDGAKLSGTNTLLCRANPVALLSRIS